MQIKRRSLLSIVLCVAIVVISVLNVGAQTAADIMRAQQDGEDDIYSYSTNPYDTDEDDEEHDHDHDGHDHDKADSVENKMRKPLESYFFSDSIRARSNFSWSVDPDYNRIKMQQIDTLLQDWRIDYPFYREGVGDMALGGLGQATQPISFSQRERYHNFIFAQPYDAYIYDVENAPFYNVKKPFTQMTYIEAGQKTYRETNFEIRHAQSVSPSTSFAIDYKSRGTKGQYQRQDTKNHNLAVTFAHTGKRYSVHAGYLNNSIDTEEGGGVVGIWAIRDSLFEMPIGVPMKLESAEAKNKYRNNTIFVKQSYGVPLSPMDEYDFSMADKTAVYLGHSIEYNSWKRVYSDVWATYTNDRAGIDDSGNYVSEDGLYYQNWYINPTMSRDSISERVISNKFFVQAQPWDRDAIVGTLDGGIGIDVTAYKQFAMSSYLTGELERDVRSSWYVYGSADGKFRRYLNWRGDIKVYPSGYRAGDISIGGDVDITAYMRDKPITLSGRFSMNRQTPSYWQEKLFSNHYVFSSSLSAENETKFDVKLKIPSMAFELGATETMVDNMIYYDESGEVMQSGDLVSVTEVYLRKNIRLGGLNLDHRILAQWTTDAYVAPVPDFSLYLSYYYEFWMVKNVLRMQLGVDGRLTTEYCMPGYNPALSTFVSQSSVSLGGYPYLDAYLAAKWKRMRILVKYQHVNQGLFGNGEYFSVANYPLNPGLFKLGISWGFYD